MRKNNKLCFEILLIAILSLCLFGCSTNKVQYIGDGTVQTNNDKSKLQLFFSLADKNQNRIKSDGTISIRIVNSDGKTVYTETKNFTEEDFNTYSNALKGEMLLCKIEIPISAILSGTKSTGLVYYTVSKDKVYHFESQAVSTYDLPIAKAKLTLVNSLPFDVSNHSWNGSVESTVRITDATYTIDEYSGTSAQLFFTGEKIYDIEGDQHSGYCIFNYRVFDRNGYVVDSGSVFTSDLKINEKFKNEKVYISNLVPGDSYTIELSDYE